MATTDKHLYTIERSTADNETAVKPNIYDFECGISAIMYEYPQDELLKMSRILGQVEIRKAGSL